MIIPTFSIRTSAQLDMIALLISDLFLITFAFLNYACFHVDLVQPDRLRYYFLDGSEKLQIASQ
jgi:hypothetical protein